MKKLLSLLTIFFLSLFVFNTFAQTELDNPIRIQRLSDRVLVLTEDSPMENIVVALASKNGLVVVDATGSPYTASLMRKAIEKEFDRNDFAYLINTHHHWDHAWGNQTFAEAVIVGHELCVSQLQPGSVDASGMVSRSKETIADLNTQLKNLDPNSAEAKDLCLRISFHERICKGLSTGFTPVPPTKTFSDHMSLDLGDLTFKLYYFGRAHSGSDILIQVPEEGLLLTGDLFLDIGWLPLFAGMTELDIPRWIEVLSTVLDGEDKVTHVIPGHRQIWSREKLALWRDYIVSLWQGVQSAKAEGLNLEAVITRFPLEEKYFYLKELGHTDAALERFQRNNITAFWRQLFIPAVTIVEKAIEESGIEAAISRYREMKSESKGEYYFDEASFNALGYRLIGQGKIKDAIEIFKLNVEAYPESWNVYDSLGEAYMNDGQKELAIKYYQKSLELNPQNENGKEMLRRFGVNLK